MYKINRQNNAKFKLAVGSVVILIAFGSPPVVANPAGASVVNGQASFATRGNTLTVTNTPGTIINWQSFSIKQHEITRFAQQSASSVVLNRVTGNNPSNILGSLQSNGRVFLINSSGIVFGAGATVDVAGMVASTLNLSNGDFLAGKYNFTPVPSAANLGNAGNLNAQNGGQIYLIAPNVRNTGVISAANGDILLAAGHSVELLDTGTPNLRVNITAPAGEAMNVGTLVAGAGNLGLYGALVKNRGTTSADSVTQQGGKIVFKSSVRTEVTGHISANGTTGGTVQILGQQVGVMDGASVTANGTQAGGAVLVGGDYQGKNTDVQNAQITFVAPTASIHADGGVSGGAGDGGKVVIWSNDITRVFGNVTASGGASGGNGGIIETSGKKFLVVTNPADAGAPKGRAGNWLLDPNNVTIQAGVDTNILTMATAGLSGFSTTADSSILTAATIQAALNTGTSVTISTSAPTAPLSVQLGDITVNAAITKTAGAAATLTLNSHNNIAINAPITSTVGALNLALNPGINGTLGAQTATISANVDTLGGTLTVGGTASLIINAGTTTLNSNNAFNNLTLTGTGMLTGTGNITIPNNNGLYTKAGQFNWTGGTLSGTGTFTTAAQSGVSVALLPASVTTLGGSLILARPFVNGGAMSQAISTLSLAIDPQGSLINNGSLVLGNGVLGGSLSVSGIFSNVGTLLVSGSAINNVSATTVGTISNSGAVSVASGLMTNGGATLNWIAGKSTINTGTWSIGSAATPMSGGVLNLGQVAGAVLGTMQSYTGAFNNVGTVNVNDGVNSLTGTFVNNGTLAFALGTNSFNGAYSEAQLLNGFAPAMVFNSGINSFNSTVAVPSIWTLFSNGGVNTFDTNTSVTNLALGAGKLTGLGSLTVPVNGGFSWTGGTLATTGVGATAATLTLASSSSLQGTLNLNRALINNGLTVQQSVNGGLATTLNIGAGGSFTNNSTFNMGNAVAGAFSLNVSDAGVFTNSAMGVVNSMGLSNAIQAVMGTTGVGILSNNGAINVASGSTLNYINGLGSNNSGSFMTAAASTAQQAAGGILNLSVPAILTGSLTNYGVTTIYPVAGGSFSGAYSGSGALTIAPMGGAYSFAPILATGYVFPSLTYLGLGTLNFDVPATITNLNLQGSSFRGNGAITIPNLGTLTVNGTTLGGYSSLTVAAGAIANMTNAGIYRPVVNLGTMSLTGVSTISTIPSASGGANSGSFSNTGILNLNSALLQAQSGGTFTNNVGGQVFAQSGANTLDASGLFFAPTQVGTISNNGSVTVNSLAALAVTNGFASSNSGTYTNAVGGTLSFANAVGVPVATVYTYTNANALANNGTASVTNTSMGSVINAGALTLSSATITGTLANNGTGTVTTAGVNTVSGAVTNASLAGSALNVAALSTLNATVGVSNNRGSAFVNAGSIIGSVTNVGIYTQTGALTGSLINTGTASLGGSATGNVSNTGVLTLNTATLGGALTNAATLNVAGTVSLAGLFSNNAAATLNLQAGTAPTLNALAGLNNAGVINLSNPTLATGSSTLNVTGTLNNSGGINSSGTMGSRVLTASSLINTGLITMSYPMTINGVSYVAGTSLPLPPVVVPKPVAPPPLVPAPTPLAVSAGILPQLMGVTLAISNGASGSASSPTVSHPNKKLASTVVAVNGELVPENSPLEKIPVCR